VARFPLSCVALILSAILPLAGCTSTPVAATPAGSPISWNGQDRIELPLTFAPGGQPTVPVRIVGKDLAAGLDTGSSHPIFSPEFAAVIALKVNDRGRAQEHVAVEYGPGSQRLEAIRVMENPTASEFIAGQELFQQAVVEFDFAGGRVTLIRPGAFIPPPDKPIPVQYPGFLPTIQIKVNSHEEPICAIVDTGYGGGVALSQKTVDELALPIIPGLKRPLRLVGGKVHEAQEMKELQELKVGDRLYRNVHLIVSPINGEDRCSALLGVDILSRHRVIFDLGNRRMWMLPRSK
jgi:hypothetical protein